MKCLLPITVIVLLLSLPALAQTPSAPSAPNIVISHEVLQAEQTRYEALIQHQRDQIAGLTQQMQSLKAQLDTLQRELGQDAANVDQAGERVNRASKQKYGVRVGR